MTNHDNTKHYRRTIGEPSQEELDEILGELQWFDLVSDDGTIDTGFARKQRTKSAINSLTLKQVLALVGKPGDYDNDNPDDHSQFKDGYNQACDDLVRELRQSAERIWS